MSHREWLLSKHPTWSCLVDSKPANQSWQPVSGCPRRRLASRAVKSFAGVLAHRKESQHCVDPAFAWSKGSMTESGQAAATRYRGAERTARNRGATSGWPAGCGYRQLRADVEDCRESWVLEETYRSVQFVDDCLVLDNRMSALVVEDEC